MAVDVELWRVLGAADEGAAGDGQFSEEDEADDDGAPFSEAGTTASSLRVALSSRRGRTP